MMTITVSGAIHDYCSREPGKVESAARHDIPVLLQAGQPMTTPELSIAIYSSASGAAAAPQIATPRHNARTLPRK